MLELCRGDGGMCLKMASTEDCVSLLVGESGEVLLINGRHGIEAGGTGSLEGSAFYYCPGSTDLCKLDNVHMCNVHR